MKLKTLSLFSGIGGIELGLERSGGFEATAFCEFDEHARKVLNKHWPKVHAFDDVNHLHYFDGVLTDGIKSIKTKIDLISGGFPCQDISIAGIKRGFEDEQGNRTRSGLWGEFARLIGEIKPRYALIENVKNLLNIGLVRVLKDLDQMGYNAEWSIISARSVGAIHLRERIFIIAWRRESSDSGRERRIAGADKDLRSQGEESIAKNASNLRREISEKFTDAASVGREGGRADRIKELRTRSKKGQSSECSFVTPDAYLSRFWPTSSAEDVSSWWRTKTAARFGNWWTTESGIRREYDGISPAVDGNQFVESERRQRIKQLGNAVVPQCVEMIADRIMILEGKKL
jgi:DNA (cytosine-5)-methyltransferase 1